MRYQKRKNVTILHSQAKINKLRNQYKKLTNQYMADIYEDRDYDAVLVYTDLTVDFDNLRGSVLPYAKKHKVKSGAIYRRIERARLVLMHMLVDQLEWYDKQTKRKHEFTGDYLKSFVRKLFGDDYPAKEMLTELQILKRYRHYGATSYSDTNLDEELTHRKYRYVYEMVARIIKEETRRFGYTQADLSDLICVSHSALSRFFKTDYVLKESFMCCICSIPKKLLITLPYNEAEVISQRVLKEIDKLDPDNTDEYLNEFRERFKLNGKYIMDAMRRMNSK